MFHGFNNKDKCFEGISMYKSFYIHNFNNVSVQESSTKLHKDISSSQTKEVNFDISDGGDNSTEFGFNEGLIDFQDTNYFFIWTIAA